jgi:hypothetical protein
MSHVSLISTKIIKTTKECLHNTQLPYCILGIEAEKSHCLPFNKRHHKPQLTTRTRMQTINSYHCVDTVQKTPNTVLLAL